MICACKAWSFCTCWPSWAASRRTQKAWASTVTLEQLWGTWNLNGCELSDSVYCLKGFLFVCLFVWLYNVVLVLPYIDLNPQWVYMCSPSWTPLPPPSPSHPSGSSQCTSPEHPVSCIKPGLAVRFTYDIYMFQCHSSISSCPRPLPQSPKDCSVHLCLFCCLPYRVITIFLNSIYMH